MTESDYVELRASTGEISRFVEEEDGWWVLEGAAEKWEFSSDATHGFFTSFDPSGGPHTALGSVLITAHGKHLVVASILMKGEQLKIILMPEE